MFCYIPVTCFTAGGVSVFFFPFFGHFSKKTLCSGSSFYCLALTLTLDYLSLCLYLRTLYFTLYFTVFHCTVTVLFAQGDYTESTILAFFLLTAKNYCLHFQYTEITVALSRAKSRCYTAEVVSGHIMFREILYLDTEVVISLSPCLFHFCHLCACVP